MQLIRCIGKPGALPLLAAAAAQLIAAPLVKGGAEAREQKWELDAAALYYNEQEQVQVLEPVIRLKRSLKGDQEFVLRLGFDAMSGASPNGGIPSSQSQTFTSPSGNSYSAKAGELPRRDFRDTRLSAGVEWTRPLAESASLGLGGSFSNETDYLSLGVSANLMVEFNQRHSTLQLGISHNQDTVSPEGGLPIALQSVGDRVENGDTDSKSVTDVLLGLTQVMNERWLLQCNIGLGADRGYLTEPYKAVTVLDATDLPFPDGALNESRPENRMRQTLLLRNMVHLGRDVIHLAYRYFQDDWEISAHTLDLKYWWKPDLLFAQEGWKFRPHLRWSSQSASEFYKPWLLPTAASSYQSGNGNYLSSDHRLGNMSSLTLGVRTEFPETSWGRFSLNIEQMTQSWTVDEELPPGLASYDVAPDLRILMVTLGYKTTF